MEFPHQKFKNCTFAVENSHTMVGEKKQSRLNETALVIYLPNVVSASQCL